MFNTRNLRRKASTEDAPYAFVFEVDGTIVDSAAYHVAAWQKLLSGQGVNRSAQEIEAQRFGKSEEIARRLLGEKLSDSEIEKISQQQAEIFCTLYKPQLRLIEGLKRFLDEARSQNIQMAIATDLRQEIVDFVVNGTYLQGYFKVVACGEDVDWGKPNPDLLLKSSLRLGMMPEDCIAFDRSAIGLQAAERAGMKAFVVQARSNINGKDHPNLIQTIADYRTMRPSLAYAFSQRI